MRNLGTPFPNLPVTIKDSTGQKRMVRRVSTFTRLQGTSDREGGECMNGLVVKGKPQPEVVGYSQLYYGSAAQFTGVPANCTMSEQGFKRAFLFDGTKMRDLNTLIPASSGWYLQIAFGINNSGQIVGQGVTKSDPSTAHAFLLLPK